MRIQFHGNNKLLFFPPSLPPSLPTSLKGYVTPSYREWWPEWKDKRRQQHSSPSLPPSSSPTYLVKRVRHAIVPVNGGQNGRIRKDDVDVRDESPELELFQVALGREGGREGGREEGVKRGGDDSRDKYGPTCTT